MVIHMIARVGVRASTSRALWRRSVPGDAEGLPIPPGRLDGREQLLKGSCDFAELGVELLVNAQGNILLFLKPGFNGAEAVFLI